MLALRGVRIKGAGMGCVSVSTLALGCLVTSDSLNGNLDHVLVDAIT
jgi:hypothetical protein